MSEIEMIDFVHPDLDKPVRLPVKLGGMNMNKDYLLPAFTFNVSIQESSKRLLSHAIFFRKLFLEQRLSPRLSCNIDVTAYNKKREWKGKVVDISSGGLGVIISSKLRKSDWLWVEIKLPVHNLEFHLGGQVIVIKKLKQRTWAYGLRFFDLSDNEISILTNVLKLVELDAIED